MAIKIKNYTLPVKLTLKQAYLIVSDIIYNPIRKTFAFVADVYSEEDLHSPTNVVVEERVFDVNLSDLDYPRDTDYVEFTENLMLYKIEQVKDKTLEECREHNEALDVSGEEPSWMDYWEYSYNRFNVSDSDEGDYDYDEDQEYIEAGKILLGED